MKKFIFKLFANLIFVLFFVNVVYSQNNPPTFTSTPITSINEFQPYLYNITTLDVDGNAISLTATTLPSWLTLSSNISVTNFVGSGVAGYYDDAGVSAQFNRPNGIVVDATGTIYVADQNNHRIRKITAAGVVTTLAGSGTPGFTDGTGTSAQFNSPTGVAVDGSGNIYVADSGNNSIRKITSSGVVSTLAGSSTPGLSDGTGSAAQFYTPYGITVDNSGNIYVSGYDSHRIRKITPTGTVTTLAGSSYGFADGMGSSAKFFSPLGLAVDSSGNIYVSDERNNKIRKITPAGLVSTLAGSGAQGFSDGIGTTAQFHYPFGIAIDNSDNLYVSDNYNSKIRKVTPQGMVTTIASVYYPYGIAVNGLGDIYVAASFQHKVEKISQTGSVIVNTLAGSAAIGFADGSGTAAQFKYPTGVASDDSGTVYVADTQNNRIRKITSAGVVTTLAGSGAQGFADGTGTAAQFNNPTGVSVDGTGNVYVADSGNNRIRKITSSGNVSTLAGSGASGNANGVGTQAQFYLPQSIYVDLGGTVYVADKGNHLIRKITSAGVVTTLAGSGTAGFADDTGTAAQFNSPYSVAVDTSGTVYVADQSNNRIRKITSSGVVSTLAGSGTSGFVDGTGTAAQFFSPTGVSVDGSGLVYVADRGNNVIRKITATGVVSTLAGSGTQGFADGTDSTAQFYWPFDITINSYGTIFVADFGNSRIRKITKSTLLTGDTTGQAGSYNVVINANDGQGGSTNQSFTITVNAVLGIEDNIIKGIALYPNPAKDALYISLQEQIKEIRIYDLLGQLVKHQYWNNNEATINIEKLSVGIYLVKIRTNKAIISVKFIKE
jgi:sugar lactone lactonase YvrE